jgi:hypothetical protein
MIRVWMIAGVILLATWPAVAGKKKPVELLTASAAAQPNAPAGSEGREGERLFNATTAIPVPGAPQIVVEMPTTGAAVTTPFPVKIHFVPSSGAKINVDSVKVEVLKMIPISLLSRVKPYMTAAGIFVPEAKIPAGSYNVHIAIADDQGREGSVVQTWTVR